MFWYQTWQLHEYISLIFLWCTLQSYACHLCIAIMKIFTFYQFPQEYFLDIRHQKLIYFCHINLHDMKLSWLVRKIYLMMMSWYSCYLLTFLLILLAWSSLKLKLNFPFFFCLWYHTIFNLHFNISILQMPILNWTCHLKPGLFRSPPPVIADVNISVAAIELISPRSNPRNSAITDACATEVDLCLFFLVNVPRDELINSNLPWQDHNYLVL